MTGAVTFPLLRWAAWAPGLSSREQWRAWAPLAPLPPPDESAPEVGFLPPLFRRRLSRTSRIALQVAHACAGAEASSQCRTVFASRFGEQGIRLDLLTTLARGEPLSPTQFSTSVHNAVSGLFSIAQGNRAPSTALSAMGDTLPLALLEAESQRRADPGRPVLVVMADAPLPEIYQEFADGPEAAHGLALWLEDAPGAIPISGGPGTEPTPEATLPPALAFARALAGAPGRAEARTGSWRWSWPNPDWAG